MTTLEQVRASRNGRNGPYVRRGSFRPGGPMHDINFALAMKDYRECPECHMTHSMLGDQVMTIKEVGKDKEWDEFMRRQRARTI